LPYERLTLTRSLANAFSYWQGQDISNATATYFDDMQQAIGHIQEVSGSLDSIRIMNGETGWPTGRILFFFYILGRC
jgi:glucan 1,3-beta-glucosidase